MTLSETLFALAVAHCLADYPLQGEFLAQAKNRNTAIGAQLWPFALPAHALIHGGFVFAITGSVVLGLAESVAHGITDWLKCENRISFRADQFAHAGCKAVWAAIACGVI